MFKKADEVVGDDGGAIAHAGALTRAARTRVQLGGTRLEATNVKPLDVVGGGESVPIFDAGLPMRKLIAASILPFAEQAPQLGEFANRILNDEQFAKLDLQMGQQVPGLLIGPPQSFEAMFLQPMAAVLLAATGVGAGEKPVMSLREGEAQTFTAIDQDKTLMFLRKGPACSLAADMPAIELSGVVRAISSAASWIWDLLVPDAGAATCGNGTVDPGEMCDHPFICKKPPTSMCPSLTFMMICGRPGWTNACQCQAPTCGDGCFRTAAGEACDKTAVPLGTALWAIGTPGDGFFEPTIGSPTQNYGCPPHLYCKSDCTCSTHSWCGDTSINPGEECDDTVDPAIWPRHGCPVGQTCSGCNCSGAAPAAIPIFDWDVKLPIGTTMNTDGTVREITAVVMKAPLTCNYNGVQDLDTEQCDTATLPDDAAASQVESLCPANDPANPRAVRDDCDMTDCSCNYRLPMCEEGRPGVQCDEYSDCAGDEICDVNCQCVGAVDANAARSTYNDCFIHADTFSSEAAAKVWGEWNAWAKNLTGRSDDLFVEPRQTVSVNCRVAAGSAPEVSDLSLSLSGTPMPDASDNLRPFMVIQSSGSEFIDSGTLIYDEYTQVDTPLRILPVEAVPSQAAQKIKAVVLPNLEAAPELAGTVEAVVPMATTSVAHGTQNTVLVNNMIEHKVYSLIPGQDYSVEIGGEAQTIKAEAADIPEGAGITIHEFKFIVPPHCGGWTGVEGYKGCPNEEDMELDSEAVKTAIEANMAAFEGVPTSAIYTGLPWERHFNYNFNMIQSVYGRAGEAEPAPAELAFGFLASKPQLAGRGGCSCYVAGGSVSANAFAPFVLVMLVPVAGIAIGAVGRRKRK